MSNPIKHSDFAEEGFIRDHAQKELAEFADKIPVMKVAFQSLAKEMNNTFKGLKIATTIEELKRHNLEIKNAHDLSIGYEKVKKAEEATNKAVVQTMIAESQARIKEIQEKKAQLALDNQRAKQKKDEVSAYKDLQKAFSDAARTAKDLAAAHGINNKAAKEAAEKANELNNRLKEIDASMGIHTREVGNYSEGVEKAFRNTGIFGEGIEQLKGIFERGHAVIEVFSSSIEKMGEFFSASKNATEANTIATEVNTVATEANTVANEAQTAAEVETKLAHEASVIATEAETAATEVNTVATRANMAAKKGWAAVAAAAVGLFLVGLYKSMTATKEEKDNVEGLTEATEAYASSLLNMKVNSGQLYDFIKKEVKAQKELEDARISATVPMELLKEQAALAREQAEEEGKTTSERIGLLSTFIEKTKAASEIELELAHKSSEIANEKYAFEKTQKMGVQRETLKAVRDATEKELQIKENLANELRRTEKKRTTLIEKDFDERKKMLEDSQKQEIDLIETNNEFKRFELLKQSNKDASLLELDTEKKLAELKDKQAKIGEIDANGVNHKKEFEKEIENLQKTQDKKRFDLHAKYAKDIVKLDEELNNITREVSIKNNEALLKADEDFLKDTQKRYDKLNSSALKAENAFDFKMQNQRMEARKQLIKQETDLANHEKDLLIEKEKDAEQKIRNTIADKEKADEEIKKLEDQLQNDLAAITRKAHLSKEEEAEKNLEDDKKIINARIDAEAKAVQQINSGIKQGLQQRAQIQQQADQKEIDAHARMLDVQAKLAAEGKANSLGELQAETTKAEEKKLQDAKKAAKQQETMALIQTFTTTLQSALKSGKPFPQAIAEAAAADGIVAAAFAALFAGKYATGVEGLEGPGTETSDSIPVLLSKGESVATAKATKTNPGLVTAMNNGMVDDYFSSIYLPNYNSSNTSISGMAETLHDEKLAYIIDRKFDSLQKAIESKPSQQTNLGRLGEWTEQIKTSNTNTVIHHLKNSSRPSLRLNG